MTELENVSWYEIVWNIMISVFGLALLSWVLVLTFRLVWVESREEANLVRISALESGRSTPMAAETRAELNAIWRKLDELSVTKSKTKSPQ